MLKSTIFREYDIRGVADAELTSDGIEQLGRAIGTYLQRQAGKRISLGRDTRLSSPRCENSRLRASQNLPPCVCAAARNWCASRCNA